MIRSLTRLEARNRLRMLPALLAIAAAVALLAACSSSGRQLPRRELLIGLRRRVRVLRPLANGGLWHDVPVSR
jgi:hypothetical protein